MRSLNLSKKRTFRQTGDTIVEVMISMAVLTIVITIAYATSTRSFHSSLNSQYRDQAVSFAQQQLELIKSADSSSSALINTYKTLPGSFCISPSDTTATLTGASCKIALGGWGSSGDKTFTVANIYTGNPPGVPNGTKTFKVTVSWTSADNQPEQAVIYYKTNDSYVSTPGSATAPDSSTTTSPPAFSNILTAAPNSVTFGNTTSLKWTLLNVKSTNCTASSSPAGFWSGSFPSTTDVSGHASSSLTTSGNITFALHCIAFDGSNADGNAVVAVGAAPVPSVTTGSTTSITYNSATLNGTVNPNGYATTYQFKYGTTASYGSTTAVTSAGAGGSTVSVSAAIGSLAALTTYHFQLCATNTYGTACGNDNTFTTANLPVPSMNYFYPSPNPIGYGSATYLYWSSNNTTSCTWGGSVGNVYTGALYGNTGYTVNCSGPGGNTSASTVVSVNPPPPPPPNCNDHGGYVNYSGHMSWSSGITGNNPCGVTISQCNVFNSGGGSLGQYGSSGSVNSPASAYVRCMDIQGHWY